MSEALPVLYVARHGETAWSLSGQHTGLTDLPLTSNGERNARRLGERLKGMTFAKVFTSPLQRATRTCELAGFGAVAETDPDLVEWNYGQYEGRRSTEILAQCPDWQLFQGRLSGRRVASTSGREGGPCCAACPHGSRKRTALFQRTLHSSSCRPLAGARPGISGQLFSLDHREPECARL